MLSDIVAPIKTAGLLLISMTLITGVMYPLGVTGLAHYFFPSQANGSLMQHEGKMIGSKWIGQSFSAVHYFWGRPSATTPFPYNAANSSGSNSGPSNPIFLATVAERAAKLKISDTALVPIDLVTASGSGLDPEISPAAALYQVSRIAKARGIAEEDLKVLIKSHTVDRTFGVLGEPRLNVLQLNLSLDNLSEYHARTTTP